MRPIGVGEPQPGPPTPSPSSLDVPDFYGFSAIKKECGKWRPNEHDHQRSIEYGPQQQRQHHPEKEQVGPQLTSNQCIELHDFLPPAEQNLQARVLASNLVDLNLS